MQTSAPVADAARGRAWDAAAATLLGAWGWAWWAARSTVDADLVTAAGVSALAACAAVACWLRSWRSRGTDRRFWGWAGATAACWGLTTGSTRWQGWTAAVADGVPASTASTALSLTTTVLALVAIVPLLRGSATASDVVRRCTDDALLVASAASVSWYLVVTPFTGRTSAPSTGLAAVLLAELVVAVVVTRLAVRLRHRRPGLLVAAAGVGLLVAVDVASVAARGSTWWTSQEATSWGGAVAVVALVAGAGRPAGRGGAAAGPAVPLRRRGREAVLPCVAALLALGASVPVALTGDGGGATGGWLHVAVLSLLVVRTSLLVRDADHLTRALEERVAHSTRALASAGRRFESRVVHGSDVVTVVGSDGVITYASPAAQRVFGIDPSQLVGNSTDALVTSEGDETLLDAVVSALETPGSRRQLRMTVPHATGREVVLDVCVTGLTHDPAIQGVVINSHDVTEAVRLEEELGRQAFDDALTGLPNRALFRDRLEHALLSRASHGPVKVLYLDLDGFKAVNDTLGHSAGDELLVAVARRLRSVVREGDTVARLGGDEFALLLADGAVLAEAEGLARRICTSLREPFTVRDVEVHIATSVGLASSHVVGRDPEALMRSADLAMYQAKAARQGGHAVYHPDMHQALVDRVQLESDLRVAVEQGQFRVVYQPLVDMGSSRVSGVEALVRWHHPARGVIPPVQFIPLAETTGLIDAIGMFVLREACRQVATWRAEVPGAEQMRVSVNLSGHQLDDPHLVAAVTDVLTQTGLPATSLVLEITESVIVVQDETVLAPLNALRALGVRLAIDDFGTGYSSLSYLHRLPVDIIKIDKSFVDRLSTDADTSLVDAILSMAATLGMATVAEGVEHEHQRSALAAQGCATGQGYHFSPPVEADELPDLVRSALRAPRPALLPERSDETTGTVLR